MTAPTGQMALELPCHRCGYDLRAQPQDGKCPECEASVAESQRLSAIPLRPAWRDADPRWRRRILAGAWILVLVPLMDALKALDWAASVPVPNVLGYGAVRTLDQTILSVMGVWSSLLFCMGVVLLFSKERGRRRSPLDWTRRWGVGCSYVALLLSVTPVLFMAALVSVGIAAIFLSMPLKYQPAVTRWFVEMSTGYLRYGAYPSDNAGAVLVAFSSIAMALACIPLFDALRSSGPKSLAAILLAPLTLFSLMYLAQVGQYGLGLAYMAPSDIFRHRSYFWPELLVAKLVGGQPPGVNVSGSPLSALEEATKWCIVLTIAVCAGFTIARLLWGGPLPNS